MVTMKFKKHLWVRYRPEIIFLDTPHYFLSDSWDNKRCCCVILSLCSGNFWAFTVWWRTKLRAIPLFYIIKKIWHLLCPHISPELIYQYCLVCWAIGCFLWSSKRNFQKMPFCRKIEKVAFSSAMQSRFVPQASTDGLPTWTGQIYILGTLHLECWAKWSCIRSWTTSVKKRHTCACLCTGVHLRATSH
jgi:hypothetical protein